MSVQSERAQRLKEMTHTAGWRDVVAMAEEEIRHTESELIGIMASRPDTLTGKVALKYAIRSKALRDFMESIADEIRLLDEKR